MEKMQWYTYEKDVLRTFQEESASHANDEEQVKSNIKPENIKKLKLVTTKTRRNSKSNYKLRTFAAF